MSDQGKACLSDDSSGANSCKKKDEGLETGVGGKLKMLKIKMAES